MRAARAAGWRVAPRGGGTKLGWGNPPAALELVLDLARLDRVIEHAAGDLVATFEAGLGLDTAQAELARAGQMLALDPPGTGATVGGVIAANASGPRRYRYGTVRDLLIGVTVVLPDGTVARAGGKVVKNVAGYDLCKLVTGSLGTLAVIVQATFRLHPRPPAQRLVEAEVPTPEAVGAAVQRLLHSTLTPSAIQLAWPPHDTPTIAVLFEGIEPSVVSQAAAAEELIGGGGEVVRYDGDVDTRWRELSAARRPGGVELKVSCLPAELPRALGSVRAAAERHGVESHQAGPVGNGIVHVSLDTADTGPVVEIVREVRAGLRVGSAVVLAAPPEVKRQVDVWGPVGDALPLMRRVKEQFDPEHLLNPGRFVGGI